jgi:hypothetical protein
MTTKALFPQIKLLSKNPTPRELAEFSLSVRAALSVLQTVREEVSTLDQTVRAVSAAVSSVVGTVEAPKTPRGFIVTGLFAKIMLEWDAPGYEGHAYTEIHRAQVDDLGQAVRVDKATFLLWVDENLPNTATSETHYYWIRHVNANSDRGAFNAVAGTPGSTADDPEYMLELLANEITESQLHLDLNTRIDKIEILESQIYSLAGEIVGTVFVQDDEPVPGVAGIPDPIPDNSRWYDSNDDNHPYIWYDSGSGHSWHDLRDPRIGQNAAAIDALEVTVNDAEMGIAANASAISVLDATVSNQGDTLVAQASQITILTADVGDNASTIVTEQQARADGDAALASEVTLLEAKAETSQKAFLETFDGTAPLLRWQNYDGSGEMSVETVADSQSGGKVLRVGNNAGNDQAWLIHEDNIPFDPEAIYRMTLRVRRPLGIGTFYAGFAGVAADGLTFVDVTGYDSYSSQFFFVAYGVSPGTGWTEYVGYAKGFGAWSSAKTLADPAKLHTDVRYVRPLVLVNQGAAGTTEVDLVKVEVLSADIQDNYAAIQTEQTARADGDDALASSITTLQTEVGENAAAIQVQTESIDGLETQFTLKSDVNGFLSGFGFASEARDATPFSEFQFLADRFAIINPNVSPKTISDLTSSEGTASATSTAHGLSTGDYVVVTGAAQVEYNGTKPVTVTDADTFTYPVTGTPATPATVHPGFSAIKFGAAKIPFIVQDGTVYMDTALIKDATITTAKIADLAVDNAKIADLSVNKLLAGIISASNIFLGDEGRVHFDGQNDRILVDDGSSTRVIIGKLSPGYYGIEIYNAAGQVVLDSGGVNPAAVNGLGDFAFLDQILAANISTYIAAAAIGEAYIGNAAVSTLKIKGEAVTLPRSYQNDASVTISMGWQEIATLTLDPEGQPILVDFSCFCDFFTILGTSLRYAYFRIVVNGVQKYIRPVAGLGDGSGSPTKYIAPAIIQAKILSSVGNNAVSIEFYTPSSTFGGTVSYRYLNVLGVKR